MVSLHVIWSMGTERPWASDVWTEDDKNDNERGFDKAFNEAAKQSTTGNAWVQTIEVDSYDYYRAKLED